MFWAVFKKNCRKTCSMFAAEGSCWKKWSDYWSDDYDCRNSIHKSRRNELISYYCNKSCGVCGTYTFHLFLPKIINCYNVIKLKIRDHWNGTYFFISGAIVPEMVLNLKAIFHDYATKEVSFVRYMAKPVESLGGYPAGLVTPYPHGGRLVIFDENGRKGLHPHQLHAGGKYRIKTLNSPVENYEWAYFSANKRKSILIRTTTIIKCLSCIYIFCESHFCQQVTSITTSFALVLTNKNGYCVHKM